MDTTIDSPHAGGTIQIYDGPDSPTTVDVVDGAIIQSSIVVNGHSVLNIRGGRTHSFIFGRDHSTVNIFDGLVATDEDVEMEDDSVANIYGGHFGDDIEAKDSAVVNLYGGTFEKAGGGAFLTVQGDGVINVYLREYEIMNVEGFDRLIGVLLDGSDINVIVLVDSFEPRSARIVLHTIPEPESLTLTVIMGLILSFHALTRRNRAVRRTRLR
ncbi:MAG: hypothetical protein IID44_32375 [Planctomycetes bacterium]|nr:hypothetical protein [Planctomycetota bacterium]